MRSSLCSMQQKIQRTKMLVTCQRFGDWFLFGLVWPYSSNQKNIMKVGSKSLLITCSSNKLWAYLYYIFLIRRVWPDQPKQKPITKPLTHNKHLSLLYFWAIGFLKLEEYCFVSTLKMNLEVKKYLETKHITSHFDVALQLNAQWQKLFFKVALEFL